MKPECLVLLDYLGAGASTEATIRAVFGANPSPSLALVVQTTGLIVRLDALNASIDKFAASLPNEKLTPAILEQKISGFTDEFAILPTNDPTERQRIKMTKQNLASVLLNPNLPPALHERLVHYQSTVAKLNLEPGLPFSHLVYDCLRLPIN